jgi:hypothetical protein
VRATKIGGPLIVSTDGGPLLLDGLAGTLRAAGQPFHSEPVRRS